MAGLDSMTASDALRRSLSEHELAPLLSIEDVADVFGLSRRTVERMIARGEIPIVRVGPRAIRFRPEDIRALIQRGWVMSNAPSE